MKIVIEIGWGHKPGGLRRVAIKTLLAMVKQRPDHEYIVCSNSIQDQLNHPRISQELLKVPPFLPQVLWDQFLFPHLAIPLAVKRLQPDVIFHTNNMISYWQIVPSVVFIHDMTPFIVPESFRYVHAVYQQRYFRFAAKNASKILTNSEHSKKDLCRIFKIPESKVTIVPLAGEIKDQVDMERVSKICLQERFGITDPFILYVGAIHPRKNVKRLIQAYSKLKTTQNIPHKLVLAGSLLWMAEKALQSIEFQQVKSHLIFTGQVTDAELVALYSQCDAFVYPSVYEGFGLPVLEAMSLHAPVITSNTSSLPEVAGNAAVLVNPLEVEDIAQGMWKVLEHPDFADELRRKGEQRAKMFSWEKTGAKVLEVLASVA